MNSFDYEFFQTLYGNIFDVRMHLRCILLAYFTDDLEQSEKDDCLSALLSDVDLLGQCSSDCELLVKNLPKSFSFEY